MAKHIEILDSVARLIEVCIKREEFYTRLGLLTKDEFSENLISKINLRNQYFIEHLKKVCKEEDYLLPPIYEEENPATFPSLPSAGMLSREEVLNLASKVEKTTVRILQETLDDTPPILVSITIFEYTKEVLRDFEKLSERSVLEQFK